MGKLLLNQGLNTAQDRSYLGPGELQVATGAYYKPGDTVRLWKILGRTNYGDAYAGAHTAEGLAYFGHDTAGNDRLVVLNQNGEVHSSTVSITDPTAGSFTTLTTGLTTGTQHLSWCHFDDTWYFCNSLNRPLVLEPDGTLRNMGLLEPDTEPVATAGGGTYTDRVTTATYTGTEWSNPDGGYDGDLDTAAYSWMRSTDPTDTTKRIVFSAAASATDSDRYLVLNWSLKGLQFYGDDPYLNPRDQEFKVGITLWKSEDAGSTWTTLWDTQARNAMGQRNLTSAITANSDQVQVRGEIKQLLANPTRSAALQIHDIKLTNEGSQTIFTTTDGIYYGVSEVYEKQDLEGPLAVSGLVTLDAQNKVTLALPTQVNAHATHFRIYRTHDGGRVPGDLRRIADVPITETNFLDTFETDKDDYGGEVAPLQKLQVTDSIFTYYPSNSPPEAFRAIVEYQNFLVALSEQFPRRLAYSLPGEPEYWPPLYQIINFPLKEHDQLQALGVAGDLLLVAAKEAMIVINGLPELEAQSYATASMTILRGAPGCVGPDAMTEYSLAGEPRVVWVSEQGVYQTNGHTIQELSGDLDWGASVSRGNLGRTWLFWDKEDQILCMGVDTDGDTLPDREYWFHMAEEHRKPNGRPKITGPHYSSKTNMVGALANDGRYRVYSLDNDTRGKVYHEKDGGTDAGAFYTGTQVPLDVKGPRQYGPDLLEWAVDFPVVRHTSWNNTALRIDWTVGRDEVGESDTQTVTMTLSTQGQTKFVVARAGEWHEVRLQHYADGSTSASVGWFEADQIPQGEVGDTQDS